MRYTTLIDISEIPALYRNVNARLLYLHLVLIAGYHDDDRDLADISIRRLAIDTGLTVSATRHALRMLQDAKLLSRADGLWLVKKWMPAQKIQGRPKADPTTWRQPPEPSTGDMLLRQREEERAREKQLEAQGKTSFMLYYEEKMRQAEEGDLEAARIVRQRAAIYAAHKEKIEQNK